MSIGQRRRIALELAALGRADQRWILKRLPRALSVEVDRLIKQVSALGPVDAELINAVLDRPIAPSHGPVELTPLEWIERLHALESAWAAVVIKACVPDHFELYLAQCGSERAADVRRAFDRLPARLPPALVEAVADLVRSPALMPDAPQRRVA